MEIDHLFIFSKAKGKEADALVDFGFFKGSRRMINKTKTKQVSVFETEISKLLKHAHVVHSHKLRKRGRPIRTARPIATNCYVENKE